MSPSPDFFDLTMLAAFFAVAFGLPALGYVFMALDIRRWLRSLRRALVVVIRAAPTTPYWILMDRPPCLTTLDLSLPCTEADVLRAYREKFKELHPDRGGDLDRFIRLQKHFEQAVDLVRRRQDRR